MASTPNEGKQGGVGFRGWLRGKAKPLAGLILAIAIMAVIFSLYWRYPDILDRLNQELKPYSYLGAFLISIVLNATIILPVSNMGILMSMAAPMVMPAPVFVGLAGGLGAAIGEMTGYVVGRSSRDLVSKSQMYGRVEGWVRRWGWLAIFILSIVPFVFDLVGIAAGVLRMPIWRFFLACWLGRTVLYVVMMIAAAYGLKILLPGFG